MSTPQVVGMCISVTVGLMTAYFWLVANRDGKPRLAARWLGVKDTSCRDDGAAEPAWYVVAHVEFWVSNLSTLPNAILGVTAKVRDRDGTWAGTSTCPLTNTNAYKEPNELPLTIPPRDIVRVAAYVWVPITTEARERFRAERDHWKVFAAGRSSPVEFLVELKALGGRTFSLRVAAPA